MRTNNRSTTRLGWTFSYVCCIFVHHGLDSTPLLVWMSERSINTATTKLLTGSCWKEFRRFMVCFCYLRQCVQRRSLKEEFEGFHRPWIYMWWLSITYKQRGCHTVNLTVLQNWTGNIAALNQTQLLRSTFNCAKACLSQGYRLDKSFRPDNEDLGFRSEIRYE